MGWDGMGWGMVESGVEWNGVEWECGGVGVWWSRLRGGCFGLIRFGWG